MSVHCGSPVWSQLLITSWSTNLPVKILLVGTSILVIQQ